MIFTFISTEPELCKLMIKRLENDTVQCFFQDDWIKLHDSIYNSMEVPDLFICDFALLAGDYFNIFRFLETAGCSAPVIYYNDPIPADEDRVEYWITQNKNHYKSQIKSELIPELNKINEFIKDPEIRKHIALLQPAIPVGTENLVDSTKYREIDLVAFRRRNNLPPSIYNLLVFMYNNRARPMTLKELSKVTFQGNKNSLKKEASVYSYISRLKKSIKNDKFTDMSILCSGNGNYELLVF